MGEYVSLSGAVLDAVGVGFLLAGCAVVGAVPGFVDVCGMEDEAASAVEDPYLVFGDAEADGLEAVVVMLRRGEDVGYEEAVPLDGDGLGGGVLA